MSTFREDIHLGHKVPLVETDDIKDGAITTDKLADGSVTTDKLADDSVTSEKIKDGEVKTPDIADGAVTNPKLATDAVTKEKMADGAVGWDELDENLKNIIETGGGEGCALSTEFGNSNRLGITQRTLTNFKNDQEAKDSEQDDILDDMYRKNEVYNKEETYSKAQLNNLITTPSQEFVNLVAADGDSLSDIFENITGQADMVYRVGNWDGEAFAEGYYSEYAWDGTDFIHLSTKTPGVDSSPTDNSSNLVTSGGVREALNIITEKSNHQRQLTRQCIKYNNGTYDVKSVSVVTTNNGTFTLSGTAESNGGSNVALSDSFALTAGVYYLESSLVEDSTTDKIKIYLVNTTDSSIKRGPYQNGDTPRIIDAGNYQVGINVESGETYSKTGNIRLLKDAVETVTETAYDYVARQGLLETNGVHSLSVFRGKKVSIIGDSISTFNADGYKTEDYRMYYPYGDVQSVEQTYWKQLIDICGGTIEKNVSWSGSCVTNVRSEETYGELSYPDFYDRVLSSLLGSPDVIIVELGQNDSKKSVQLGMYDFVSDTEDLSEAQFCPAYIKGIKALKELYPTAEIYCISTKVDSLYKTAIETIANYYGCYYVDVSGFVEQSNSNGHPTAEGMRDIACKIAMKGAETQQDSLFKTGTNEKLNPIVESTVTFVQGGINNSGEDVSRDDRIRSGYIDADAFVYASVDAAHVIWGHVFDINKNRIASLTNQLYVSRDELPAGTCYIRFLIANRSSVTYTSPASTEITPEDETGFTCYVNKAISNVLQRVSNQASYDSVGNAEFWLDNINRAYSDMTVVGNKLIGFTGSKDDLSDTGTIFINLYPDGFNAAMDDEHSYTLKHKWGHCNTIDYNKWNDCLILGNGSGSYRLAGKIIIIPNFSDIVDVSDNSTTPLTLSDVNAIVIDCEDYELGTKFNLVWGDDHDKKYNLAYLITADFDTTTGENEVQSGDLGTIRKIVLCMGDDEGDYGTIISGAGDDEFNGTFDIVETFNQTTAGYADCDQGTCYYNGKLMAAIGHDGLRYWKMRLSNGDIFREDYKQKTFYANKASNYGNASGICVTDGYLFIGRNNIGVMAIRI